MWIMRGILPGGGVILKIMYIIVGKKYIKLYICKKDTHA